MKRAAGGVLILLATLAVLIGGGLWLLNATFGGGMCQTTVYSQVVTSSEDLVARVQMKDCGATTGFSRVVMVQRQGFLAQECRALALKGEPHVKLAWIGSGLRISHDSPAADVIAHNNACFGHVIQISREL